MVTFPFLFGMMFGDIAHGAILFIFGLYLLFNERAILNDKQSMLRGALKAKYLVTMMGFFAVFCGFIYNDFASIALPLTKTCYQNTGGVAIKIKDCSSYFGIDYKWYSSSNELAFLNSLKMKLAVIFGVLHMMLGIFIKGLNFIFFGDMLGFWFEFIPQFIFMGAVFGYMDFMIIYKWLKNWEHKEALSPNIT